MKINKLPHHGRVDPMKIELTILVLNGVPVEKVEIDPKEAKIRAIKSLIESIKREYSRY